LAEPLVVVIVLFVSLSVCFSVRSAMYISRSATSFRCDAFFRENSI